MPPPLLLEVSSMGKVTDLTQMQSCMERTSDCLSDVASKASAAIIQMGNVLSTPMTGATSSDPGQSGMVPAPAAGDNDKVLHGDGAWASNLVVGATAPSYSCIWIKPV